LVKGNHISSAEVFAIVLMAGKGTRMKSVLPKVLHKMAGHPMGWFVLRALDGAGVNNRIIVTGFGADAVEKEFAGEKFIRQEPQLGTGDAVRIARKSIPHNFSYLLIVNGDNPLLTSHAVKIVISLMAKPGCKSVVSCDWSPDPGRLGRIVTDETGNFVAIREAKDLKPLERDIDWVNVGLYGFDKQTLFRYLDKITPENRQKEYYLTDIPGMIVKDGGRVEVYESDDDSFLVMPNSCVDVAAAGLYLQNRFLESLMENGVSIVDPSRTCIDYGVQIARDVTIYPDSFIRGKTSIGKNSEIGPSACIEDSKIGAGVKIRLSCIEGATIEDECSIGPFSHLRPGAHLKKCVKIGNFCEIKKSVIGQGTKINHLSYIGDATIGKNVNIGAGTITCNFDGFRKHKTFIGDGAFIGSDSILVAPVRIGAGTLTGAGSVITRDVPSGQVVMGVPARVVRKLETKNHKDKNKS